MGSITQQRLYFLDAGFSVGEHSPFRGRILSSLTDGSDERTIIDHMPTLPDGIVIDHAHGHMYWTNMGTHFKTNSGSIERANLDGSDRTTIIPSGTVGVFTPKQLTLAGNKLYWCDREGMKVMRANRDGSNVEVLVSTGDSDEDRLDQMKWCVGITVDERRGYFYWSQKGPSKGGKGRILRAPIDGHSNNTGFATPAAEYHPGGEDSTSNRPDIEVIFDHLPEPIDLEMDEESQTLYWTDRGDPPTGNSLNRAAIGLGGQRQVLAIRLHETIGLALDRDADVVYVTDLAGGVYAIDIKKRTKKVLFSELGDLTGIALS